MATFIVNNNSHKIIYYKPFLTNFCGNSDLFEFNRFQRFAVCQFENLEYIHKEIIISCKNDYKILCSYYTKGIFQKYCLQKQRKNLWNFYFVNEKDFCFLPKNCQTSLWNCISEREKKERCWNPSCDFQKCLKAWQK